MRGMPLVLERLQDDLQRRDLLLVGLGDDDGEIDAGEDRLGLEGEFDRAGAIEEGEPVAHEVGLGDVDLDAHLMGARLGRGVADRVLLGDRSLPGDRPGPRQDRFEQGGLAACEWPGQRDAPGPGYSAAVCHGRALPFLDCDGREAARPGTNRLRERGR